MKKVTRIAIVAAALTSVAGTTVALAARGHDPDRTIERVESELDLDTNQSDALRTLVENFGGVRDAMRGDAARTELRTLLEADTLDQGAALALIESRADALRERAPAMVAAAATFLDGLDADQRAELLERLERRGGHRHDR